MLEDLGAVEVLGEGIGGHVLGPAVLQGDLAKRDLLAHIQVPDSDVLALT